MRTKEELELEVERLTRKLDFLYKDVLEQGGYVPSEFASEVKEYFDNGRVKVYENTQ